MRRLSFAITVGLVAVAAPLLAQGGGAPFTVAETGQTFSSLDQAVEAIGNGTGTIVIAPGTYRQCAVQEGGIIEYRAAEPGTAILSGAACESKAALVLRGQAARVAGLVFADIAVPDGNGAGIRIEQGDVEIVDSLFRNSQQGILSADDAGSTISVDHSTFSGLGRCDEGLSCAHSIYVGGYGGLEVTNSRFERGRGGHYIKSRAARILVAGSSFDDTQGHATNYMIDLPAGATGEISHNMFVQGRDKENYSAFIAVGAEDIENTSAGLVVEDNEAAIGPGIDRQTAFVADWTGERLALGTNRLGPGITAFETR